MATYTNDEIGKVDLGKDDEVTVTVDDEKKAEDAPLAFDEDSPNIVLELKATEEGLECLKKIGEQVIEDTDEGWDGSEEYRTRIADNYKIYSGFLPDKPKPFAHCSNAHIPLMIEGVSRLEARTIAEVFLTGDDVFNVMPVTTMPEDEFIAKVLTRHGNWQVKYQITDFMRQMQRACHLFYNNGDFTIASGYDEERRMNRHEALTCDELVTPYTMVSTMPDYSDVPWKTRILRMRKSELERKKGLWEDVDEVVKRLPNDYDDEPGTPLRSAIAEVEGHEQPDVTKRNGEYKLYRYDGWYCFPGEERDRPITAVVDSVTKRVMQLFIRDEIDWQDDIRYKRQVAELEQFVAPMEQFQLDSAAFPQAQAEYEQFQQQRQMLAMAVEQPGVDPMEAQAIQIGLAKDDMPPPQPPQQPIPPPWYEEGVEIEPPRRIPIEMYSHVICIENQLGSHGLSPGQMYADENRAVNNIFNQFTDQATLNNTGTYIASELLEIEPGEFEIGPGLVNRIPNMSPADAANAFKELRPGPASPQMIEAVNMIYGWSQSAFGASAALSGEPGKSGETYRGFASRVEQALKQLSVTARKFVDGVEQVLRNNAKLNSMYLAEEEMIYVTRGIGSPMEKIEVRRDMYKRNYNVVIRADMRFASQQQKIAEADEMVALPQAIPPLQQNLAWWWSAAEKALKARGQHDMIPMLGPKPPQPTTPLGLPPPPPPGAVPPGQPQGAAPQSPPPPPNGIPGPRPQA